MPLFQTPPPLPPLLAVLPKRVELVTVRVPELKMPPPMGEKLPEIMELETVAVPLLQIPPPRLPLFGAELSEIVELETARVPEEFKKAQPFPEVIFPPETVAPEIDKLPPDAMLKIPKLRLASPLFPLIVRLEEPGPVMVRVPPVAVVTIEGSLELRVMVPVTEKAIESFARVRLAFNIACLREPAPESLLFITV